MKRLILIVAVLFLLPNSVFCQDDTHYSSVNTHAGEVRIPGNWQQLNTMDDSGQTYLVNAENVIIAVAKNPQRAYPFYDKEKSDYENVQAFYQWDSDYRRENNFKTDKLKENSELEYVIWKFHDGELENVFLFGVSDVNFLNLLVYTKEWSEENKILFLENLYDLNK